MLALLQTLHRNWLFIIISIGITTMGFKALPANPLSWLETGTSAFVGVLLGVMSWHFTNIRKERS